VRAIVANVDKRNPWTVLERVTRLVGGSSPSEWAKYLEAREAKPMTWSVQPTMRLNGERGVRAGDRVPCPRCHGWGYRTADLVRPAICDVCDGDAFVEVG
jgi:hypothetical protein